MPGVALAKAATMVAMTAVTPTTPTASARKPAAKLTTLDKTRIDDTRIKVVRPLNSVPYLKSEARQLGWDSSQNYVSDVAPGYSIGGDKFGNYEGLLPDASGRKWYEADANYTAGPRGAERVLYSSDGLVYYTNDHYQTFTEMHPSGK